MKSVKLISLGIAMLISFVNTAQENKIFSLYAMKPYKPQKILYLLNGKKVNSDFVSNIDENTIEKVDIEKGFKVFLKYFTFKSAVLSIKTKPINKRIVINKTLTNQTYKKIGQPLFVVNGEIKSRLYIKKIRSELIDSIKIIKDSMAIKRYGEKGKFGVILIKIKSQSTRVN